MVEACSSQVSTDLFVRRCYARAGSAAIDRLDKLLEQIHIEGVKALGRNCEICKNVALKGRSAGGRSIYIGLRIDLERLAPFRVWVCRRLS